MNGEWNGSRWWKFDFHAHTPASGDYGKGSRQAEFQTRTPREWLLDYMKAGIDCVAITDHNSGAWIDQLKTEMQKMRNEIPEGFRPLHLFPGVEISVNGGIHLLAIFDNTKSTSDVDSLLGAVGYAGKKGESDAVTEKGVPEVVEEIVSKGGIAIPAHIDKAHGLFKGAEGTTLKRALDCGNIFAMELVDASFSMPELYRSAKLNWTPVIGSDAHHPMGRRGDRYPGSHFTWVKMGEPRIEGLRLALLDGSLSAVRSEQECGDPNKRGNLMIESIEIKNTLYMGRARPFRLEFSPWLNAVIGGRGTGKSSLVEFFRMVLRREDELPEALRDEFQKYRRTRINREDDGLLTTDAAFELIYHKDGTNFRIQWNPTGSLDPIQEMRNGNWKAVEGDIRQRFPIRIYSQKQIFQLAKAPGALLGIINEAPEVDFKSWQNGWREEQTRFLSLRAKTREVQAGLAGEAALRGELDDLKRKLSIFEETGQKEVLREFQNRGRQKQAVESRSQEWGEMGSRLRKIAAEIVPESLDVNAFDLANDADNKFVQLAAHAHENLKKIGGAITELASDAEAIYADWTRALEGSDWKFTVTAAGEKYEALRLRLEAEGAGNVSSYGVLVQRRQTVEKQLDGMKSRRGQIGDLEKEASASLDRLTKMRQTITTRRQTFLRDVLKDNKHVRMEVLPYGAREMVESDFRKLIRREGGGFDKDIGSADSEGLLGTIYEHNADPANIEKALRKIKTDIRKIASGDGAVLVSDRRFAQHIAGLPPESLDRIDTWFPEDSLDVRYSTHGRRENFRPIQEGSPGQKTAAMLAFLLTYGDEPLILDQPEDDLDNHLIYDLVVAQLREVKGHRQVIVVTHNANIVVNGDAEMVIALCARGGETQFEARGCLQEEKIRHTICGILEGGREAFEQRYRRITQEPRHV